MHQCSSLNPNEEDLAAETPLMNAIDSGNLSTVKFVMNMDKTDCKSVGKFGENILHRSAQAGHLNIFNYLKDCTKWDIDSKDFEGNFFSFS